MIKHIAPTDNSFVANGRKYLIHNSLSIERFEQFEELEIEVGTGLNFAQLNERSREAYAALNGPDVRVADAAVTLHGIITGTARHVNKRKHPMLLLCCLFICREGEDRTRFDQAEQIEKIADWRAEGYSIADFFSLAFNLVSGLKETLDASSPNTFQKLLEDMETEVIPKNLTNQDGSGEATPE